MEDDAEIYDGIRAQFPLTFGKQSKPQTPLEAIHNTTRRQTDEPTKSSKSSFPSVSSSSKAWLDSFRPNPKPDPNSNPSNLRESEAKPSNDEGGEMVGPPRPPSSEEDDGQLIGPPPPMGPVVDDDEDNGTMIGPPRPPEGFQGTDSDEDGQDEEEEETRHRIPMSNEIVLKGHSKVRSIRF